MSQMIQRTVALCLAATLTLVMLGGVDHLAQRDDAAPQWSQHGVQTLARN